jgi:UDP-N-acetylglucosamine--N-acetylmuramyl-(pentapeptide) pyrophosphoryl-undecaprenol N-acetylglucosamine transferase
MKTILFAGGGTLGPVTPLLAVARRIKKLDATVECAWAGTSEGPEREVVGRERIPFHVIPTAKLPRYFSLEIFSWPSKYFAARRAAAELLDRVKPSLVVGAGGFTQVPVILEAAKRKIPCVIHQLDAEPGLSNRAVAKKCVSVTTSFAYEKPPFGSVTTERIATPCRFSGARLPDRHAGAERFFLDEHKPIVFIFGGGTGAAAINEAIRRSKSELLTSVQLIHQTGKGKRQNDVTEKGVIVSEFFDEQDMLFAYAAADIVICRAGMGALSDLAALKKTAIVIPIPNSHQEKNLEAVKTGVLGVHQTDHLDRDLTTAITDQLKNASYRAHLGETLHALLPTDDGTALAHKWLGFLHP